MFAPTLLIRQPGQCIFPIVSFVPYYFVASKTHYSKNWNPKLTIGIQSAKRSMVQKMTIGTQNAKCRKIRKLTFGMQSAVN